MAKEALIVAQEEEFPYPYSDERCHLWFWKTTCPGMPGTCPKANGYVNVGVGGKAERLKANGDSLKRHWNRLVENLDRLGLVQDHAYKPSGHSYYLRQRLPEVRKDNAFWWAMPPGWPPSIWARASARPSRAGCWRPRPSSQDESTRWIRSHVTRCRGWWVDWQRWG